MLAPTLTIFLLFVVVGTSAAVDCRLYPFAPPCRGVPAKRAFDAPAEFYADRNAGGPVMGTAGHSRQSWRPQPNEVQHAQAPKADTIYDWYLNNRKRAREPDLSYDY